MTDAASPDATTPLAGLRVLDLGQYVAAPYAAKLLAMFGADVVKVERPVRGDPVRHVGPFAGRCPGPERSLLFLDLNVGKRGVTLDLSTATGRALALDLVTTADIVVESFRPGTLDRFGLGPAELERARPGLLLTSISNFGQTGPYRDLDASELGLYAMGHEMYGTGLPEREPLSLAPRLTLYYAGMAAAVATVAGALAQRLHGRGDHLDVSILETFASCMDRRADSLVAYAYSGEKMVRMAQVTPNIPQPYTPCRDGHVVVTLGGTVQWHRWADAIGHPELHDERYQPPHHDPVVRAEIEDRWHAWCAQRDKADIAVTLQRASIACAPVNSIGDLATDANLLARDWFATIEHPVVGPAAYAGPPFVMAETPARLERPAPRLGEHNAEVYGALGHDATDLERLATAGVI